MPIKAIIVDDEYKARELLKLLLKKILPETIEVCATCSSVSEALVAIHKFRPALVFLDIEMPNESGFALFGKLGDIVDFEVIFTSAYSKYAIDAFKVNALDYILKPIEPQALLKAVQKIVTKTRLQNTLGFVDETDEFNPQKGNGFSVRQPIGCERIMVPTIDGIRFFFLDEVIRLEADGAYTRFIFKTLPVFLSSANLGEYEEKLIDKKNFIRIHRSVIININEVVHFTDPRYITMSDEVVVNISRYNKEIFIERMRELYG